MKEKNEFLQVKVGVVIRGPTIPKVNDECDKKKAYVMVNGRRVLSSSVRYDRDTFDRLRPRTTHDRQPERTTCRTRLRSGSTPLGIVTPRHKERLERVDHHEQ